MTTAATIIKDAMVEIGAVGSVDTPEPDDSAIALRILNRMLDAWTAKGLLAYHIRWESVTLTAATASRTIGPSGNINTTRPVRILNGSFTRASGIDKELMIGTRDQWAQIEDKTLVSERPGIVYYEASSPLGVVHFWPLGVCTAYLALEAALTAFVDQTTDYTLPPGYEDAIVAGLSERLCSTFARPVPAMLRDHAANARKVVERVNFSVPELVMPDGVRRSSTMADFNGG